MIFECWVGFKICNRSPVGPSAFPESALGTNLVLTETLHRTHTFGNEDFIIRSGEFAPLK